VDAGHPTPTVRDWRSPDARDVAAHRLPPAAARIVDVSSDGFDWGDAAIGAAPRWAGTAQCFTLTSLNASWWPFTTFSAISPMPRA
jgi:hypothetical protein